MNSFYSLIKLSCNPTSDDQITVGLIASSENRLFLKFSDRKAKAALHLLDEDDSLFVFFKKQLNEKVKNINKNIHDSQNHLFALPNIMTADFILHMNKMCKNMIKFSEPSFIKSNITEEEYSKLYELFVEKYDSRLYSEHIKDEKLYKNILEKLIKKVENKIHTNIDITNRVIPSLNFSLKLDCIGKNGKIVSAKSIDFNSSPQVIEKNIIRYEIVLDSLYDKWGVDGKAYLISDEPTDKKSENYNVWEICMKKNKSFEVITSACAGKVADYIEKKNAQKFLQIEE